MGHDMLPTSPLAVGSAPLAVQKLCGSHRRFRSLFEHASRRPERRSTSRLSCRLGLIGQQGRQAIEAVSGAHCLGEHIAAIVGIDWRLERHPAGNFNAGAC